jgi:hypothetical protein
MSWQSWKAGHAPGLAVTGGKYNTMGLKKQEYPSPPGSPMMPYFVAALPMQNNPAGNVPRRTSTLIANILPSGYSAEVREQYEEWAREAEPSAPLDPQNPVQLQPLGDSKTKPPPQHEEVKAPSKWAKYPPKSVGRTTDGIVTKPRKKPVAKACKRCSKDHV